MTTQTYMPAEVFPGDFLRDELDERGWTITEFAEIIGRPVQAISEILTLRRRSPPTPRRSWRRLLGRRPSCALNLRGTIGCSRPARSQRKTCGRSARRRLRPVALTRPRLDRAVGF